MIATPDNPCECGNTDYVAFWCSKCKRLEDYSRDSVRVECTQECHITNDEWVNKYMKPKFSEAYQSVQLRSQIAVTKEALKPNCEVFLGLCEVTTLIDLFFNYMENKMDKKTTKVKTAMKKVDDVKKGDKVMAVKAVKGAMTMKDKMKKKGC